MVAGVKVTGHEGWEWAKKIRWGLTVKAGETSMNC